MGTKDHDVSQNIDAFLSALPKEKTLDILDFGCGPGRDMRAFKSMGHRPVGLDGSKEFCKMAEQQSDCPTLNQQFLNLKLEEKRFDGIFANASLFHVPSKELPRVLNELHCALRKDGILFSSNPRGNAEGWQGQRYGHFMEFEASETYLQQSGFKIIEHFYRPARDAKGAPAMAGYCQSASGPKVIVKNLRQSRRLEYVNRSKRVEIRAT